MDDREILTRFKAGTLDRGQVVRLLARTVPADEDPAPPAPVPLPPQEVRAAVTPEPAPPPPEATRPAPVADDRVAVIGIAGRYPLAADLDAYWNNLCDGRDTATDTPIGRPGPVPLADGQRAHFLDNAAEFDPDFFGLTARDGALMDPQERLFLETVWQALEDAGCTGSRLDSLTGPDGRTRSVGVFAGVSAADYALLAAAAWDRGGRSMPRSGQWSLPGRPAELLGLTGPVQAVDAADASALAAVHLAVGALRRGECAAAVAGGAELLLHPSRGREGAGEGVGALVLKPLAAALADGDRIHAVVRETSTGPGGAPAGALRETRRTTACRVGEAGAALGAAALTAAVLQLRHAALVPIGDGSGAAPWAWEGEGPRTAVVDFGAGTGPGARVVLEEPPRTEPPVAVRQAGDERDALFLLSGPTPTHLAAAAERLADWLAGRREADLAAVARELRCARAAQPCRLALRAATVDELASLLRDFTGAPEARHADLRAGGGDPLLLAELPETADYLAALWRGRRVEQLTRLWLSGVDVDWAGLERREPSWPGARGAGGLPGAVFLRRELWLERSG
ncbi:beta-ketoacyl synthase N-terminal-like domain-containing protein [Streptomyces sp. NPDC001941]|uniref:beta-ketoacyl synthase N-terminal-like domain-containing protein n=1 Tax=Streptomyces sp. NPDC001941 TaxID=3154659 RepID=UPI003318EEA6